MNQVQLFTVIVLAGLVVSAVQWGCRLLYLKLSMRRALDLGRRIGSEYERTDDQIDQDLLAEDARSRSVVDYLERVERRRRHLEKAGTIRPQSKSLAFIGARKLND